MNAKKQLFVSCPGKILVSGGYSILKEGNIGLSLAISAKFYAKSRIIEDKQQENLKIIFNSPQIESQWTYSICNFNGKTSFIDHSHEKNVFLIAIFKVFCSYLRLENLHISNKTIEVSIFNDKEFYSLKCIKTENEKFPIFSKENLKKTGLGSSACLIVSVLTSLLLVFELVKYDENTGFFPQKDLSLIHLLSQITNTIAQNKIGSGFDISTAVYGTQIFMKFPEKLITESILRYFNDSEELIIKEFFNVFQEFQLYERNLRVFSVKNHKLFMMDFTLGSDTRILVAKVKEFLKGSHEFIQKFYEVSREMTEKLIEFLDKSEINVKEIKEMNLNYRKILKKLGLLSNVAIEPDVITVIINFFIEFEPNFIYFICPGAGGYDAACCLLSKETEIDLKIYENLIKELKQGKYNDKIKSIYETSSELFNENFDEILLKIKEIDINFFERSFSEGGLRLSAI